MTFDWTILDGVITLFFPIESGSINL